MEKTLTQRINRSLVTCEHGMNSSESCWWCQSTKNKPIEDRMDKMEEKFAALLNIIKLLTKYRSGGNGYIGTTIIQNIMEDSSLIKSGLDSDKPADGGSLAFYMATDSDTIYQRRDNAWVDISYSRPDAPDIQVTDVSIDGGTGALQITTP